jgi:UDP-3-O-acyl N-acetylglucosamine deacetylase
VCRTLLRTALVRGVGIFTGSPATLALRPGTGGALGVRFRRVDVPAMGPISAHAELVLANPRHTVLADPRAPQSPGVQTIEHMLAALSGLGIWSAEIELDGPEVPIMDGSAEPFVRAVMAAGVVSRPGQSPPAFRITEAIVVESGAARIEALPLAEGSGPARLEAEYLLDYGESGPIPRQSARVVVPVDGSGDDFVSSVAPARTFSLLAEALAARQAGLFAHLTPAEMLVIGDDGRPIDNRWRLPDEPARHKLLDLVGDLALVGGPVVGRVVARRSGHALNHALAKAIRERVTPV